jgi:hypothetical protein
MSNYRNKTYTCGKCEKWYCEDCFEDVYDRNTNEYYINSNNGYDDPEYCVQCKENKIIKKKYENLSCNDLIEEIKVLLKKKSKKELIEILKKMN